MRVAWGPASAAPLPPSPLARADLALHFRCSEGGDRVAEPPRADLCVRREEMAMSGAVCLREGLSTQDGGAAQTAGGPPQSDVQLVETLNGSSLGRALLPLDSKRVFPTSAV